MKFLEFAVIVGAVTSVILIILDSVFNIELSSPLHILLLLFIIGVFIGIAKNMADD